MVEWFKWTDYPQGQTTAMLGGVLLRWPHKAAGAPASVPREFQEDLRPLRPHVVVRRRRCLHQQDRVWTILYHY